MKKQVLILWLAIVLCHVASSQEIKFGKVDQQDLESRFATSDSNAVASVLYRKVKYRYHYVVGDGFHLLKDVHERIKIYKKDGYGYATVSENLYKSGSSMESLKSLKGYTFNLENGEITKDKLGRSDSFKETLNSYYDREKFTMPNVREGSVLDYEYTVESPFYFNMDEVELQYDIPILRQEVSFEIPEFFVFRPHIRGFLGISPQVEKKSAKINYTSKQNVGTTMSPEMKYSNRSVDYQVNVTRYDLEQVPALESEPFVSDMDNFRGAVKYELQYIKYPDTPVEYYTTSWEQVIERIYESDEFGAQIKRTNFLKEPLDQILDPEMNANQKVMAIYRHIQEHMVWNGLHGYYTDKGLKKAYEERKGNIGDINLLMIAMMREAGLQADPVLISTRDHGIPIVPTIEGFNYVVGSVQYGNGSVLLDASSKLTQPGLLPPRAINWLGKVIDQSGSFTNITLYPSDPSKETHFIQAQLDEDGAVRGKMRSQYTDYFAMSYRQEHGGLSDEAYQEQFQKELGDLEIGKIEIKNQGQLDKPVLRQFDFQGSDLTSAAGDLVYFSPLLFLKRSENPFKLETREYPIDFVHPWNRKYVFTIILPEGYHIESVPEDIAMALPDNIGGFSYQTKLMGGSIQLMVEEHIDMAVISPEYYPAVRELFKKIVEKQSEQVVLSK